MPGTASAAPFGELPFRPVRSSAVCLSPAGAPGQLVRWVPSGAELLSATPAGLVPQATIALGPVWSCPVAAADASGAGVVAAASSRGVRISARDPGHAWGAPVAIPGTLAGEVAVAVSASGDAVVAWVEYEPVSDLAHVRVVRRVAGGAFGAPQRFDRPVKSPSLQTAVTADGVALLVLAGSQAVQLASAAPGAPFGSPRTLARGGDEYGSGAALAVAPDGRALLAVDFGNGVALFDREPGGALIQRPTLPLGGDGLAVALAPGGTAVVASESGGSLGVIMRDGVGAFGAPIHLEVQPRPSDFGTALLSGVVGGDGPPVETSTPLRVVLGADRRALITWAVEGRGLRAATLTTAGVTELAALASPLRDALGATPVLLADDTRAVAWTDGNDILSSPPYAGRLHLALEGVAGAPVPTTPALTVGAPRDRTLRPAEDLVLPVRCSAACDVRTSLAKGAIQPTVSLERAGTALVRFRPSEGALAPARGALKVKLTWSSPAARIAKTRTVAVRLRRLPAPPFPRLENVRARRGPGGVVDVRWSTDLPARDAIFFVYGSRTRNYRTDRDLRVGAANGAGRRVFHVRLRDAADVRHVRVRASQVVGTRTRVELVSVGARS